MPSPRVHRHRIERKQRRIRLEGPIRKLIRRLNNELGVVSVEWIILTILVMAAIIAAFAPNFVTMLNSGVTAVSNVLANETSAAGS
jgi:Flp pilus assembly pilin Flp